MKDGNCCTAALKRQMADMRSKSDVERVVRPDWQITTILPGDYLIETDCNSGRKRRLKKSKCSCGQPVLIQLSGATGRRDGKRVFYTDEVNEGWDAFRCKSCHKPVHESVPGAEYDEV